MNIEVILTEAKYYNSVISLPETGRILDDRMSLIIANYLICKSKIDLINKGLFTPEFKNRYDIVFASAQECKNKYLDTHWSNWIEISHQLNISIDSHNLFLFDNFRRRYTESFIINNKPITAMKEAIRYCKLHDYAIPKGLEEIKETKNWFKKFFG